MIVLRRLTEKGTDECLMWEEEGDQHIVFQPITELTLYQRWWKTWLANRRAKRVQK